MTVLGVVLRWAAGSGRLDETSWHRARPKTSMYMIKCGHGDFRLHRDSLIQRCSALLEIWGPLNPGVVLVLWRPAGRWDGLLFRFKMQKVCVRSSFSFSSLLLCCFVCCKPVIPYLSESNYPPQGMSFLFLQPRCHWGVKCRHHNPHPPPVLWLSFTMFNSVLALYCSHPVPRPFTLAVSLSTCSCIRCVLETFQDRNLWHLRSVGSCDSRLVRDRWMDSLSPYTQTHTHLCSVLPACAFESTEVFSTASSRL